MIKKMGSFLRGIGSQKPCTNPHCKCVDCKCGKNCGCGKPRMAKKQAKKAKKTKRPIPKKSSTRRKRGMSGGA